MISSARPLAGVLAGSLARPLFGRTGAAAAPVAFRTFATTPKPSSQTQEPIVVAQPGYQALSGFQLKPASPSYFTTKPVYNELIVNLDSTYRQYRPHTKPSKAAHRPNWLGKDALTAAVGVDALKTSQYRLIVSKLNQLATLTPRPATIDQLFSQFAKTEEQLSQKAKPRVVDHLGRALATGRRKEASASVYVVEGEGKVLVNGQEAAHYFKKSQDRDSLLKPFEVTQLLGKYNVWALVQGGGTTGKQQQQQQHQKRSDRVSSHPVAKEMEKLNGFVC
jgi:small subunit ribosomal protein S9